jgi:hypothetical protein
MDVIESGVTVRAQDQSYRAAWSARLRSRGRLELAIIFAAILIALWSERPLQKALGLTTFLWIVVSILRSGNDAASLGLRVRGMRQSLWIVGVALALAAFAIAIAWRMHTVHIMPGSVVAVAWPVAAYMLWALIQQFILQDFFLLRLLPILPTRTAAVMLAAVLFAVAHLPNPLLTVMTLVWGAVSCALFLRYRNLYWLGIAHGVLGICLSIAVPNAVHHQMRVGLGYLRWHAPAMGQVK